MAARYYAKLPPRIEDDVVLITDPMLATGGSAVAAIDIAARGRRAATSGSCASWRRPRASRRSNAAIPSADLHAGGGPRAERPQVHRPGPGRLRRSAVRHGLSAATVATSCRRPRPLKVDSKVFRGALGSAVEHRLHTAGVGGSNPPARTSFRRRRHSRSHAAAGLLPGFGQQQRHHLGVVARRPPRTSSCSPPRRSCPRASCRRS